MKQPKVEADLEPLNEILAELEKHPGTDLTKEHLEGARFYMTGSMPDELAMNLKLAEESLNELDDEALKTRIRELIKSARFFHNF